MNPPLMSTAFNPVTACFVVSFPGHLLFPVFSEVRTPGERELHEYLRDMKHPRGTFLSRVSPFEALEWNLT